MRRPELAAGLLAFVLGLLHLIFLPDTGTDLAAQLARASFARDHPLTPVDLSWYGGSHPFGYSLLAPWVMAVVGVGLTGLFAAVAGSVLLARLFRDSARPMLASVVGAVFVTANVASGRTTFALGAVAALGALVALPHRRRVGALAVLAALLSPVAAAFLGLAAAVLVITRRPCGWTLGLSATIPVLVLSWLFPGGGVQPMTGSSARNALLVVLALAFLTSVPIVRTAALLYAIAIVFFWLHNDPFGSNILRLGLLVAAAVLLATARRPWPVVALALLGFLAWQMGPPKGDLTAHKGPPLTALTSQLVVAGAHRVEVVAPRDHRESYEVALHVPLARGWARQLDYAANPLFYKGTLTPAAYLAWLHQHAVDYVAVPKKAALDFGSTREGALLRAHPVPGLEPVWSNDDWVLYRVTDPTPLVAQPATVFLADRTQLGVLLDRPAAVVAHIHWSRWLSVVRGDACIEKAGDGVRVRAKRAGPVVIGSSLRPRGHC